MSGCVQAKITSLPTRVDRGKPLDLATLETDKVFALVNDWVKNEKLKDRKPQPLWSFGNNRTWLECAERVILEVNSWQDPGLEGMHDVYYGLAPRPFRKPIPLVNSASRSICLSARPESMASAARAMPSAW